MYSYRSLPLSKELSAIKELGIIELQIIVRSISKQDYRIATSRGVKTSDNRSSIMPQ